MLKDEVFGEMRWAGDLWTGTAKVPYFRGAGERIQLTQEERAELPSVERLPLRVDTGGVRRRPNEMERGAWREVVRGGKRVWDGVMDALVEEYRRQRPRRVRYWEATRGAGPLMRKALPARVDREGMKRLVVPMWVNVRVPEGEKRAAHVVVSFLATWWSEGVDVYVQEGRVVEVTATGWWINRKRPRIETEAFGVLRRPAGSRYPWAGEVVLEAFREFGAIEVDRAGWDMSYTRSDAGTSDLLWDVARGESLLMVYADAGKVPTARQAEAFREFVAGQGRYGAEIVEALLARYKRVRGKGRRVKGAEGLAGVTDLTEVGVFPEEAKGGVAIGLLFRGPWTGDEGVGVRWRAGKVEEVGGRGVAVLPNPTGPGRKGRKG